MTESSQKTSDVIEGFLLYLQYRKNRSPTTIITYRSMLSFFVEYIEDCTLDKLTLKEVDNYAMSITVLKLTPKSYRNRLVPIRSLFKYMYLKDMTDIRPESIDIPADPEQEANFLDAEEQDRLVNACRNPREKAIVKFLIRSGARISELVDAKTSDLYNRSLVIPHGKGNKPRVTFITEAAQRAIKEYHSSLAYKPIYLFTSAKGEKLSRQYVHRVVVAIAERAEIEKKTSPHTLRHTFATNLLMNGARIEDVQQMLGHKNIRTTQIYMHFTNDYLQKQYDRFMPESVAL